jgi:hypothetical protein
VGWAKCTWKIMDGFKTRVKRRNEKSSIARLFVLKKEILCQHVQESKVIQTVNAQLIQFTNAINVGM